MIGHLTMFEIIEVHMTSIQQTVAEALALMQAAKVFHLRNTPGLKPTLWRTADKRHSAAPVLKDWLSNWLEARDVESPFSTAIAVLRIDFTGSEFPLLADDVLELIR
jgi:hypothetical protein